MWRRFKNLYPAVLILTALCILWGGIALVAASSFLHLHIAGSLSG